MTEYSSSKLVKHWRAINILIAPGNSEEMVRGFESSNGVILPRDFREYYLCVNGMVQTGGQDCDPNGFAFWPLARVKSVTKEYAEHSTELPEVPESDHYFVFVDYLQWCWAYAIRLNSVQSGPNPVIQVGTIRTRVVADSFTEFVELYLRDAEELYSGA